MYIWTTANVEVYPATLPRNLFEYSVGSEERLELEIEIFNDGEDAYESSFYLELPESVNYVKTELRGRGGEGGAQQPPVLCSAPAERNRHTLKCDLGNPMVAKTRVGNITGMS